MRPGGNRYWRVRSHNPQILNACFSNLSGDGNTRHPGLVGAVKLCIEGVGQRDFQHHRLSLDGGYLAQYAYIILHPRLGLAIAHKLVHSHEVDPLGCDRLHNLKRISRTNICCIRHMDNRGTCRHIGIRESGVSSQSALLEIPLDLHCKVRITGHFEYGRVWSLRTCATKHDSGNIQVKRSLQMEGAGSQLDSSANPLSIGS